jgi:thioredoxin 1
MASANLLNVTEDSFNTDVLEASVPVVVDFWAVWCGPCKAIAPVLERAAGEYEGRFRVAKVDVDGNRGLAMKYQVRNIPTLLLFKDGAVVAQHVGALNRAKLDEFIAKAG